MIRRSIRERLRRSPFHIEDRRAVPWTVVDVDASGEPIADRDDEPQEPVTHWTGKDGRRVWVIGDD